MVPLLFFVLSLAGLYFSGMSTGFVINEVMTRFVRDGVMVLALIIPIRAGMGLNFAVVVGAMCAQVGLILAVDYQLSGLSGLCFITLTGVMLSLLTGYLIGRCLNRVRGKEMITTIIIGFVGTGIYQLVFMAGYGTVITPGNPEMMLSRGIGIRNMVDLEMFRNILDTIWLVTVGDVDVPIFMIMVVILFAMIIGYLGKTPMGQTFKAVSQSNEKAMLNGIDTNRVRISAIMISTVLACFGHILYIQNIGMLNVYTAHLNTDIFSCAALLAGGASISKATIRHAFLGIILFHTLFIVSPQAGQNLFGNPALGEYFRSFVAYGTIAFALMMSSSRKT
ncbi:MAG: ABC transporter permease [Proteobacteria bacterium]|nr:ABC transporter permease [Pseudomonadota bacterium]